MASLAVSYASNDIKQFEKILSDHKKNILGDPVSGSSVEMN
jgi:hypothetical protein